MTNHQIRPRLVVFVPGLRHHLSTRQDLHEWKRLRNRLANEPRYSHHKVQWELFDHGSTVLSRGGLRQEANKLKAYIEEIWTAGGGHKDIVLVAHSLGGPILRAAYLLAAREARPPNWTQYVSRFVLFASVNRGIDTQRIWWLRPIAWLARHFGFVAAFRIVDGYRGSDFLTNLRIDWIQHFGARRNSSPQVIQVLGTNDSLVRPEDSKDVLALPDARQFEVSDAGHADVYYLGDASSERRYAILRRAFCEDSFNDRPRTQPTESDQEVNRIIFLLHGIRASNVDAWIREIEAAIAGRSLERTRVVHPSYGYFSAARFVLPSVRRRNIATFQDWYTEVLAQYPTAKFSIIAHSNGSYILGHSLRTTPGMRFDHVALAGSVLPRDFWQGFRDGRLRCQVDRIRNHRAKRDWPVAVLCSALRGLRMRDIGTAGFAGFDGTSTDEVAYYRGGHGDALRPEHHASLVDFVLGKDVSDPNCLDRDAGLFRQLSNAAPHAMRFGVLASLFALGWFVFFFDGYGSSWENAFVVLVLLIALYVVADIV